MCVLSLQSEGEQKVREMLWNHCGHILETRPSSQPALTATVFVCLEDILSGIATLYSTYHYTV